ncbi:MAG TPA: sigma-70 family RNA polymerase sigma factor [Acidobacteriota bacterium]|nr:sigma-70 family RNA polymerase sigma factor [Acidobacteriota bacterium]
MRMMRIQDIAALSRSTDQIKSLSGGTAATETRLSVADAELLARLRTGNREAFEELVTRYQSTIYNLAYRLLNDPEDARDVTQEIFLKIYQAASSFRGECEFRTWIYRITVNQVANQQRWWRRRWRRETISLETTQTEDGQPLAERLACATDDPEQKTLLLEQRQQLTAALAAIKFDFRGAAILRDVKEMSYEEIADALQISVGTVKSRIARGREELRRRLKHRF